ncbi:hypothetical protein GUJ93_ZPchr0586g11353 [Zizania palustris]|uniref:Uncharacterized protein n=1 Tax=Zizania palustris TaxID=103762 RepID=A0A8J5RB31_ZIZPA|nr:hypothetical protein GUJ93_ZPchr0586g11353 [Zizania palustris]
MSSIVRLIIPLHWLPSPPCLGLGWAVKVGDADGQAIGVSSAGGREAQKRRPSGGRSGGRRRCLGGAEAGRVVQWR